MKKIWIFMEVAAVIFFYALSVHYSTQAQKTADIAVAALTGEPLLAERASEICGQEQEQEIPRGICFWGETQNRSLSCQETGKSSIATCIETVGNPELVISGSSTLAYQSNGCFIDKETSAELFGTENGNGQTLWYEGTPYLVCGTFDSLRKLLLCQAGEDAELNMVSLFLSDGSGDRISSQDTEQFLIRYSLEGESMDVIFLNALANDLLLLLPLLLGTGFAGICLEQGLSFGLWYKKAVFWVLGALMIAGMLYLTGEHLQIPSDMIPTKWSDFSFWKSWWQKQQKNLLLLLSSAQGERQLDMLWNLFFSFAASFGTLMSGLFLLLSLRKAERAGK